MSPIRLTVAVLACCGVVCSAMALLAVGDAAPNRSETLKDAAWVERRIARWQPTKAERAFEEIGWAGSLTEAESLAKKHGRGIFLFTYDGASLTGYRC